MTASDRRVFQEGGVETLGEEPTALPPSPSDVIIVEYRETGLALPEIAANAIKGLGNTVVVLIFLLWPSGGGALTMAPIRGRGPWAELYRN
ncbi:hypothetical protein [Thiomonas sp. FB-6]|uniref:hypothetical protein n=1 Tax=Thiomonas sp. FB-6 TaxID=1158291 RepID=UPI0012DD6121|nr:hypothetical protein [Thiomonas sp. FB-6]